jgi:aminobenzoyl-glutamate utilization protein B
MSQKWNSRLLVVAIIVCAGVGAAAQSPGPPALKQEVFRTIDGLADRLGRISDAIFSFSEIGFQETNAAKLLADTLEKAGFRVDRGVADMPTAYLATWGSGSPVISIDSEYDCVPLASQKPAVVTHSPVVDGAPGHGEGHNTNPETGIGAAIAIKSLMEAHKLAGTIRVIGAPAEEVWTTRGHLVNKGLFKGVDVAMDAHIGTGFGTSYGLNNFALVTVQWTFTGRPGGSSSPWSGRSGVDAVELMDVGIKYLGNRLPPDSRVAYVITNGGQQPNVIPELGSVWYDFRQHDYSSLMEVLERARHVARGAAEMTETTVSEQVLGGSWPILGNESLAKLLQANIELVGMPKWSQDDVAFAEAYQRAMGKKEITGLPTSVTPLRHAVQGSSTSDAGDITWNVPFARMAFPSQVEGATAGHHWSSAIVPATPVAHKGLVVAAKALAGTIVDLLTDPRYLQAIKSDFARDTRGITYRSMVPLDIKPPIYLTVDEMAKWRPLLEKHYYNPDSPKSLLEEWGILYPPAPVK